MNEDFKQITECYQILNESPPNPQRIEEASKFLIDFYSRPESFSFLVNYILNVEDLTLQKAAIVGMKMILANNSNLLQDQETYISLLNLSVVESSYVRKLAIIYLSLFNSPTELIIQFIQSLFNPTTESTINKIQIESCMKLMAIILTKIEEEEAIGYIEFCSALSTKAFQSSNIDLLISGAIFRLTFIPFIQDQDQNPTYLEYMNSSFQVLYHLLEQKSETDQIDELIQAINTFVNYNPDSIDYRPLFEVVINYISTPDISKNLSEQLLLLSDNVLESCQYSIKSQENPIELILHLLNAYCIYAKKTYNPTNSYDLSDNLIFLIFFKVFYEDQYISEIYSIISSLFNEGSSGKFVTLLILDSSFKYSSEFYHSKINEIINIFQISLSDEDFCVRSTSSISISDFCQYLYPRTKFDTLITSLFECLSNTPSGEFLTALTDIFDIVPQTDTYFDQSVTFLFQFFNATGDILLRQKIFNCLSSLTKSSRERVCAFFDQIFSAMSHVVLSASSDEMSLTLLPSAITCLSHLCFTCSAQISTFAASLLDASARWLMDDSCQTACIVALSSVVQNFSESARQSAPQIVKALFDIASQKVDLEEFPLNGTDDIDDDDEEFAFKGEFVSKSSALRSLCDVLAVYQDMLAENFDALFAILLSFKDHPSGYGTVACAKGATRVARALIQMNGSEVHIQKLIGKVLLPLAMGSDFVTSGEAFLGLSVALKKGPAFIEKIFDAFLMALNGHLFFQNEIVSYNETLFNGLLHLAKTLMRLNFFKEMGEVIPIVQEFLSKSDELRGFSLKFFAAFVSAPNGIQFLNEELVSAVIQVAMVVSDGYASIEFLTKLTETVPESISELAPKILEMIGSRLFESNGGDVTTLKSEPILTEKCIVLLHSLLKKTGADISPFVPLIIQSTPPIILLRKSGIFFEILHWIIQKSDGSLTQQIAAAAIRFFSEPDSLIAKRNLSQDQIGQMKAILQSMAQSIQNFSEFCAESCQNDEFKMANLNRHVFES